jgi:hypothetical protein
MLLRPRCSGSTCWKRRRCPRRSQSPMAAILQLLLHRDRVRSTHPASWELRVRALRHRVLLRQSRLALRPRHNRRQARPRRAPASQTRLSRMRPSRGRRSHLRKRRPRNPSRARATTSRYRKVAPMPAMKPTWARSLRRRFPIFYWRMARSAKCGLVRGPTLSLLKTTRATACVARTSHSPSVA